MDALRVANLFNCNNMNQICTNEEQSHRLLEAGVRPDTADMYLDEFELPVAFEYGRVEKHVDQDMALPAWSLSELIDMIPDQIECEGYNYYLFILPRGKEFTIKYSAGSNLAQSYCRESLFDAITEMIEWLIKEGYLDKKLCGDCRLIEYEDANGEAWCAFHQKPVRCDIKACKDILEKGVQNA